MNIDQQRAFALELEELARRQRESRLDFYRPYPKQAEFHALGATKRERMLAAANQSGKTYSAAQEVAMHLTGRYPAWWQGRRFPGPITAWAAGVTSESTRDTVQRLLLGELTERGTGAIPKACIANVLMTRGIADSVDSIVVRHVSGETSTLQFKSYERGREKWQGSSCELMWLDEEPPADLYSEALARTVARQGMIMLTATPLLGMTSVVRRFFGDESPDRARVMMALDEAEHVSEEDRKRIEAGYQPHERDARLRGLPMLGSGIVFPVAQDAITVDPFPIPAYWPRIVGLDFGVEHPTSFVTLAIDEQTDTVYAIDCYRQADKSALIHAAAINARAPGVPVSWPHDGWSRDKGSGDALADIYRRAGVRMLPQHATFEDGGNGVEAGIAEMLTRFQTGRLKIFSTCVPLLEEIRTYHRKDGKVVAEFDDTIAACRYALMMKRHARVPGPRGSRSGPAMARDIDYPIFSSGSQQQGGMRVVSGDPGSPTNPRPGSQPQRSRIARGVDDWSPFGS